MGSRRVGVNREGGTTPSTDSTAARTLVLFFLTNEAKNANLFRGSALVAELPEEAEEGLELTPLAVLSLSSSRDAAEVCWFRSTAHESRPHSSSELIVDRVTVAALARMYVGAWRLNHGQTEIVTRSGAGGG